MNRFLIKLKTKNIEKIISSIQKKHPEIKKIEDYRISSFNLLQWSCYVNCDDCIKTLIEKYNFDINIVHQGISPENKEFFQLIKEYVFWTLDNPKNELSIRQKEMYPVLRTLRNTKKIDIFQYAGATPLVIAIQNSNIKSCRILIKLNADINKTDDRNMTPLMYAIINKSLPIVKLLLENNASIYEYDNDNWTATFYAASRKNWSILELLMNYNANPYAQNKHGVNAFMIACNYNQEKNVKYILEYNNKNTSENINLQDENGYTGFMKACIFDNVKVLNLLIDFGADTSLHTNTNFTSLMIASKYGNSSIVKLLIKKQAKEINAKDEDGRTALYYAMLNNQIETAIYLIFQGAKLSKDKYGFFVEELNKFSINKDYFMD